MSIQKRYLVFVSSTFYDLETERAGIMRALLETNCIPTGMELFPAASESSWSLIQRMIDDVDYYVVILAGRYGSIGPTGLAYTEMEYDYAQKIGKPILAFLHANPSELPVALSEPTDEGRANLARFRRKIESDRQCRYWKGADDLSGKLSRTIAQSIVDYPRPGWISSAQVASSEVVQNLLSSEKRLREVISSHGILPPSGYEDLYFGSHETLLECVGMSYDSGDDFKSDLMLKETWDHLFFAVAIAIEKVNGPDGWAPTNEVLAPVIDLLEQSPANKEHKYSHSGYKWTRTMFKSAGYEKLLGQFIAMGFVHHVDESTMLGRDERWRLSPLGKNYLRYLRAERISESNG